MRTPSEIARKALEGAFKLEMSAMSGLHLVRAMGSPVSAASQTGYMREEVARSFVNNLVWALTPTVTEAIEDALRQCPVPGGADDEYLDTIRELLALPSDEYRARAIEVFLRDGEKHTTALIGHIDHLHRVMHTPESQAIAEAYDAGMRAGRANGVGLSRGAVVGLVEVVQAADGHHVLVAGEPHGPVYNREWAANREAGRLIEAMLARMPMSFAEMMNATASNPETGGAGGDSTG